MFYFFLKSENPLSSPSGYPLGLYWDLAFLYPMNWKKVAGDEPDPVKCLQHRHILRQLHSSQGLPAFGHGLIRSCGLQWPHLPFVSLTPGSS